MASKVLRESQAAGTDKCPELKILKYLIKNGWKKPPETEQLDYQHVYDKYHRYSNVLKEVNGSIYRVRIEEADSADNEQTDRIKPPSCGRELQWIPPLGKRWHPATNTCDSRRGSSMLKDYAKKGTGCHVVAGYH